MLEHFKDIEKVQEVLCQAQTGLWAIELDEGRPPRMYADSSMLELLGYDEAPSPEECYQGWYGRIEEECYPVVHDVVERMKADERAEVQYSWNHPKWGKIYVRCGGVRDAGYGPGVCLRGYHQNITDTIMLKQEAERKAGILTKLCSSYYSVYVFDLEHDIEEAVWQEDQQRREEFPAGSLKMYYDKFIQEYVWPDDQEKMKRAGSPQFLKKMLSSEQPAYDVDYRRIYPEGPQWVRARFSIEEMKDGVLTKVIFANMNIHEQKLDEMRQEEQNQNALLAAYETAKKANEAKSNFLAQMSHDIRTPMNAIIGMTSIAASHAEDPEKVRDCLEKISSSSSHLLKLINEVLDMSKIEKGKVELAQKPFYLDKMIQEVDTIIRTEAAEKEQDVHIKIDGIIHNHLEGDELRIRQVLLNLCNNAVKYTPKGGKIRLEVHELSAGTQDNGRFVFIVEDNGIGMPESFKDYIFVPFSRAESVRSRNIQGTGLGMSIAQGIVEAMQGNIQVESEENRGSRFTVTLNLKIADGEKGIYKSTEPGDEGSEHKKGSPVVKNAGSREEMKGMRLLLVEDNALNQEIARTLLEEAGFQIDCADDGAQALENFRLSEPGTYKAVLMDLQMPVMDGCTAAREIRRSSHPDGRTIPIIALTANAFAEDVAKALAAGMDDHISKPIDYQRLLTTLERVVFHKEEL